MELSTWSELASVCQIVDVEVRWQYWRSSIVRYTLKVRLLANVAYLLEVGYSPKAVCSVVRQADVKEASVLFCHKSVHVSLRGSNHKHVLTIESAFSD